jgi:hypothetical protein
MRQAMQDSQRGGGKDPPCPLPAHLRPRLVEADDDTVIVGNVLRLAATLDELDAAVAALRSLGLRHAQVMLTHRDGSPWLEVDAVQIPRHAGEAWPDSWRDAPTRLALWRYTLAVYIVGRDGAVADDPFYRPVEDT